jgi:hypothetical protein
MTAVRLALRMLALRRARADGADCAIVPAMV